MPASPITLMLSQVSVRYSTSTHCTMPGCYSIPRRNSRHCRAKFGGISFEMWYRDVGWRFAGHNALHRRREQPAPVQGGGGMEADGRAGARGVQESGEVLHVVEAANEVG